MKLSYYILNENDEVIAIFKDEEYARDYLDYMMIPEEYCKKGVVNESVFRFEEHDAKYHTMEDSSLKKKQHIQCRRFRYYDVENDYGYCFLIDEIIQGHDDACSMIRERDELLQKNTNTSGD